MEKRIERNDGQQSYQIFHILRVDCFKGWIEFESTRNHIELGQPDGVDSQISLLKSSRYRNEC